MFSGQWPNSKDRFNSGQNLQRFSHSAGAILATRHLSLIRANNHDAVSAQLRQIALGRWMLPHSDVHRRRNQNLRIRGQQQR